MNEKPRFKVGDTVRKMADKLKPCKYCGCYSPYFDTLYLFFQKYTVCCPNCNYTTEPYKTHKEAAEEWNRRAGEE